MKLPTHVSKSLCWLFISGLISFQGLAQHQAGLFVDNYTPIKQHLLNPSAIVDQKVWLDINLVGAAAFARNNLVYLPSSSWSKPQEISGPRFNNSRKFIKAHIATEVLGPSISFTVKQHSFGLHTAVRGYANVNRIPGVLDDLMELDMNGAVGDGLFSLRNARVKGMAWGEVGLSYGKILKMNRNEMLTGGITVNRMIGLSNLGIMINRSDLSITNAQGVLASADGQFSYAAPAWNAGRGWGANLGFTFKKMEEDLRGYAPHSSSADCMLPDYKYKIGFSVTDIGGIRFDRDMISSRINETMDIDDLQNIGDAGDISDAFLVADSIPFTAALPTTISGQFDYNMTHGFYFNATIIHRLVNSTGFGVERANLLAVSARYESKFFGVSFPLSLYEYTTPQLGMMLRMGPVIIGSDHALPFIIAQDIYAGDIFVYVNFSINKAPSCWVKSEKNKKRKKINLKSAYCPQWKARTAQKRPKSKGGF